MSRPCRCPGPGAYLLAWTAIPDSHSGWRRCAGRGRRASRLAGRRASRLATALAVVAAVLVAVERLDLRWPGGVEPDAGAAVLAKAWREGRSDVWVEASGEVVRVLSDDRRGSRHQRFLVQIAGGPRVLIAHNIDLAPRVADLRRGDTVRSPVYPRQS